MNQTGVTSVGSRRQARKKGLWRRGSAGSDSGIAMERGLGLGKIERSRRSKGLPAILAGRRAAGDPVPSARASAEGGVPGDRGRSGVGPLRANAYNTLRRFAPGAMFTVARYDTGREATEGGHRHD